MNLWAAFGIMTAGAIVGILIGAAGIILTMYVLAARRVEQDEAAEDTIELHT